MRLMLVFSFALLGACTSINRSVRSGYADRGTPAWTDSESSTRASDRATREAREELGFGEGPLDPDERRAVDLRARLKRAEALISDPREKRAYYAIRANLADDEQRLQYAKLTSPAQRTRFLNSSHVVSPDADRSDEIVAAIEAKDIALGMTQKAVNESWGDPDQVETSGDRVYGLERWRYNRYVSGGDGYRKEVRLVYFDGGRVVGWERL